MTTKDLKVPEKWRRPEWTSTKVVIKKWDLGTRNDIMGECSEMNIVPGVKKQSIKYNWSQQQMLTILHCVVEAPWTTGRLDFVRGLDPAMSDWLFGEIDALNEGDIKNSGDSEESSEEKPSQPDQSKEQSNSTS